MPIATSSKYVFFLLLVHVFLPVCTRIGAYSMCVRMVSKHLHALVTHMRC